MAIYQRCHADTKIKCTHFEHGVIQCNFSVKFVQWGGGGHFVNMALKPKLGNDHAECAHITTDLEVVTVKMHVLFVF